MKRIWIAGNSGSGKTTLANLIGEKLGIPVYHRDYITWHENFVIRTEDEQIALTRNITKTNQWVFEGARFTASKIDGRLERCDTIIHLELNRLLCTYRVIKRAWKKAKRTDLSERDKQPFNFELLRYTMWEYPIKREQRKAVFNLARNKRIKVIILRTKKEVKNFLENLNVL